MNNQNEFLKDDTFLPWAKNKLSGQAFKPGVIQDLLFYL